MKPTFQFDELKMRGDAIAHGFGHASVLPKTDYSFQTASMPNLGGACCRSSRPSFRAISEEYFKDEARHSFVSEAAVFGVIAVTVIVPLIATANAVLQLIRSVGTL